MGSGAVLARPRVMFSSAELEHGMGGGFERHLARTEMGMSRSFGEPLSRGVGKRGPPRECAPMPAGLSFDTRWLADVLGC